MPNSLGIVTEKTRKPSAPRVNQVSDKQKLEYDRLADEKYKQRRQQDWDAAVGVENQKRRREVKAKARKDAASKL